MNELTPEQIVEHLNMWRGRTEKAEADNKQLKAEVRKFFELIDSDLELEAYCMYGDTLKQRAKVEGMI